MMTQGGSLLVAPSSSSSSSSSCSSSSVIIPDRLRFGLKTINEHATRGHKWAFPENKEHDSLSSSSAFPSLSVASWDYVLALKYYRGLFTAAQVRLNNCSFRERMARAYCFTFAVETFCASFHFSSNALFLNSFHYSCFSCILF